MTGVAENLAYINVSNWSVTEECWQFGQLLKQWGSQAISISAAYYDAITTNCEAYYRTHTDTMGPVCLWVLLGITVIAIVTMLRVCCFCRDSRLKKKAQRYRILTEAYNLAKTAYEEGHSDRLAQLIENNGLDINRIYSAGESSLFLSACLSGEKKIIKFMLNKGADVHMRTHDGDTCLYLATYGILNSSDPDVELLQDLCKAGCSVNGQNHRGYTPLHRAASKGNIKVISALRKLGADPYFSNTTGIYPIDSAINAGHVEAAKLLKIKLDNPYLWDIVEPHTPPAIRLGLQSPLKKHLLESTRPTTIRSKKDFFAKVGGR